MIRLSQSRRFCLLSIQIVNQLLIKGFIILCLIHPVLTLIVLNSLLAMASHEACHLGYSRTFLKTHEGFLKFHKGGLSAYVILSENIVETIIICFSPVVLGVIGIIIQFGTKLNLFITLPWILNIIGIFPFSQDMKTFSQWVNRP